MSGDGRKSSRAVTSDEADLWHQLASTVEKARAKPRVSSGASQPVLQQSAALPAKKAASKSASAPKPPPPSPPAHKPTRAAAPLAQFDRRTIRQIASGKIGIDARLDLHGSRLRDARAELKSFLLACQARGARTVLVITGKGGAVDADRDHLAPLLGEPQRGILRRNVPQWLADPEFRLLVLSFTAASARHGGNGALYVQLRKA
jgi:DNA-nicking Smr family endonuclease